MDKDKINYIEAAELTGLPVGTLYSMVHKRKIPHYRISKRLVRFSREKLNSWMNQYELKVANHTKYKRKQFFKTF